MDRGMQMGEDGGPSGATPLREPSALEWIAHLVGSIYCHGGFRAETENERLLEARLIDAGFRYRSTDEVVAGEARLRAPEAASAEGSPSPRCIKCDAAAWSIRDGKRYCHYCQTPSGPSQDSQEVSAENIDWVEAVVVSYNEGRLRLRDVIYKAITYGRKEWAALSQSPKGAAGATVADALRPIWRAALKAQETEGQTKDWYRTRLLEFAGQVEAVALTEAAAPSQTTAGELEQFRREAPIFQALMIELHGSWPQYEHYRNLLNEARGFAPAPGDVGAAGEADHG